MLRDGHVNLAARARRRPHGPFSGGAAAGTRGGGDYSPLTDAGASVDDIDRLGRGALHLAALAGNPATTRVLLQRARGPAPRRRAARGHAGALCRCLCARRRDGDAVRARRQGRARRARAGQHDRSPLHWSALSAHRPWASQGSLRVADELLAAGRFARARDRTGATPAHAAARLGADAWLDQLAKRDTGLLDERDNRGVSPLDMLGDAAGRVRVRSRFAFGDVQVQLRLPRPFSRDAGRRRP